MRCFVFFEPVHRLLCYLAFFNWSLSIPGNILIVITWWMLLYFGGQKSGVLLSILKHRTALHNEELSIPKR